MAVTTFGANDAINEESTALYSCVFKDQTGAVINGSAVSALTATLRDVVSGSIINSRNAQSALSANGGSAVSSVGAYTLTLSTLDTVSVAGSGTLQPRRLTLIVTYSTGVLTHEVQFYVRDLSDVT